jgi:hypothetical protein
MKADHFEWIETKNQNLAKLPPEFLCTLTLQGYHAIILQSAILMNFLKRTIVRGHLNVNYRLRV